MTEFHHQLQLYTQTNHITNITKHFLLSHTSMPTCY